MDGTAVKAEAAPLPATPSGAEAVARFLRANPGWLAANPEFYRILTPPARVHGERLADHMAAMLRAVRAHADAMAERADLVLTAGRASAGLAARVNEAVLALMRAADPMDCVAAELPGLLAVDSAAVCSEGAHPGARTLPAGTVERLMAGREVVFRAAPSDAGLLHGEAAGLARHDVLVRVAFGREPTLLALAARDGVMLDPVQGNGALAFLGRAVAAALLR